MAIWIVAAIVIAAVAWRAVAVTQLASGHPRRAWLYLAPGLILAAALPGLLVLAIWPAAPVGAAAGLLLAVLLAPLTFWLVIRRPHDMLPGSDANIELGAKRVLLMMVVLVGVVLVVSVILVALTVLSPMAGGQ